jgi:O-antigen/teichoic acid export membrane protein
MLGPEGRGTAYTILAISAILSAILSGGSSTTLRIAFLKASGKLGAKFFYQLVLATVILVFASALYLLTPGDKILTSHQATLMVMATACAIVASNLLAILLAKHQYLWAGLLMLITPLSQLLLVIFGLTSDVEELVSRMFLAFLLSNALTIVLAWVLTIEFRVNNDEDSIRVNLIRSTENLAPLALQQITARMDLVLATIFFGTAFGGRYSLALMVAIPVSMVHTALLGSYLSPDLRAMSLKLNKVFSFGLLIGFGLLPIGALLIVPIFGKEFEYSIYLSFFTVPTAVLALMASFTSEIMVGAGLGRVALRNLVTSLAIFGLASTSILFVGELGFLVSVAILFCVLLESNLRKMNTSFLKLRPSLGLASEAWRDLFVRPMK